MLLGEPPPTPYDINFSVMGVPVRVHPLFFLGVLIFAGTIDPLRLAIFGIAVFVSILVHELGHVMAFMYYGTRARVVLHFMGGLAIPDRGGSGGIWSNFGGYSQSKSHSRGWSQIIISFAGPFAGFVLAAVVVVGTFLAGGRVDFEIPPRSVFFWQVTLDNPALGNLYLFIENMLYINIFWGLVNLLPIFPLDGGQISRELFVMGDPWNGVTKSLWLSCIAAAAMGVWMLTRGGGPFGGIWFLSLAYGAYQQLQSFGGGRRPW